MGGDGRREGTGILLAGRRGPAAEALAEAEAEAAAEVTALAAAKAAASFVEAAAASTEATRPEKEGAMLLEENCRRYRGMRRVRIANSKV